MRPDQIIVTDDTDGILTSWWRSKNRWYKVWSNENEVLSVVDSPYKGSTLPFILQIAAKEIGE